MMHIQKNIKSSYLSVCLSALSSIRPPAWNNSAPHGQIFMKF